MKKLMIALAAVAMAISVNAAQWTWGISALAPIYQPGVSEANLTSGTAYLYAFSTEAAAKAALSAFVDDFASGSLSTAGYVATQTIDDGGLSANVAMDNDPWSGMTKGTTVYWAMLVETTVKGQDYILVDYISAARNADGKNKSVTFSEDANSLKIGDASKGYSNNGYYQTVPEPTSGLLLLLGMAGLALRRRRA